MVECGGQYGACIEFRVCWVAGAGLGVLSLFKPYLNRTMEFLSRFLEGVVRWWCGFVAAQAGWVEVAVGRVLGQIARLRLCRRVAGGTLLEN